MDETLRNLPGNSPIILKNETCAYCNTILKKKSVTKEHVIGRNFIPKGKLNRQWNLIILACKYCNNIKSKLEDDISAITMQPNIFGKFASQENILKHEALRKGKGSKSRITGKSVIDSSEQINIHFPIAPGAKFTFNLTAPPQLDERAFQLAQMQLMAFFYWITYNHERKKGGYWPGVFIPIQLAPRCDWGNPLQRSFMDSVVKWEPRVLGIGAEGFFKVIIRKNPNAVCWSWALEWNMSYRLIGLFGEPLPIQELKSTFPIVEPIIELNSLNHDHSLACRLETSLNDEDDILFQYKVE